MSWRSYILNSPCLKDIIESLLFFTEEPLRVSDLIEVTGRTKEDVEKALKEVVLEYDQKGGLQILQMAGGYQMATRPEASVYIEKMEKERKSFRLSQAAIECLAITAYKQPITRIEIEAIRGVRVDKVLDNLLKRKLIKITGRKDAPGRPMTFGTTNNFLKYFGLNSINDLPPLENFNDIQKSL